MPLERDWLLAGVESALSEAESTVHSLVVRVDPGGQDGAGRLWIRAARLTSEALAGGAGPGEKLRLATDVRAEGAARWALEADAQLAALVKEEREVLSTTVHEAVLVRWASLRGDRFCVS